MPPWDKYAQAPVANPVIAPPDPYKQANEQRAQVDQSLQIEAAERARQDQALQERAFGLQQEAAARSREQAQRGSVDQGKAASFAKRAVNAEQNYSSLGVGPRSYVGEKVSNLAPDFTSAFLDSTDRRQAEQAEREFIAAILRYDSGAAIPPEEFVTSGQIYFPRPGDGPEEIEQKTQARRVAIEGLLGASGPAGAGLEMPRGRANEPEDFWPGVVGEDGKPLPPEGGYGLNPETGEWQMFGRITDDAPSTYDKAVDTRAKEFDTMSGKLGAVDLAGEGLMLGLGGEAAGVGTVISGALTGDFNVVDNYLLGRDVQDQRLDEARDRLGWGGTAAEVLGGGGLAKVGSGFSSLLQAGRGLAAKGAPVTRSALQGQMARSAAAEGAMAGGVGGFGYGEGLQGSATNALLGAGTAGAIGFAGQKLGNALANRSAPQNTGVQQAATDLQIPVIPAVTGGTTSRRLTAGARQGFISDRPIAGAVARMEAGGAAARDKTAAATGRVLDGEEAGDVVRQAANVYSRRTSDIGGKLYARADRIAGGEQLPLPSAIQAADTEMAQLAKGPGGTDSALYRDIAKLREQMAAGSFEVDGIRAFRSRLRNELTERGLRGTPQDAAFSRVLQAAEDDMVSGLQAARKDNAAGALRTASAFWRKRVETIDEVLDPVLGKNAPRSGEQIVSALERMANPKTGNASRLRQLFQAMPDEEGRSVSATLISRMGRPTPGAAEKAEDGGFSFNTFLTNWNNMSPKARTAIFPKETREALDKLATVSQGVKQAGSAMNTSNTAGALTAQAAISGIPWLIDPLSAVGITGGQWVVGRLLASPRVARWVASAPKNPNARSAHIARLGGIARAEPALANEIGILERALNDNAATVTGIAAEEPQARQQ